MSDLQMICPVQQSHQRINMASLMATFGLGDDTEIGLLMQVM